MQKSLYNQRTTVRGDNILHQQTKNIQEHSQENSTEHLKENPQNKNVSQAKTTSEKITSSEDVISRFVQKNSAHIQRLQDEPVLLVQKQVKTTENMMQETIC